MRLGIVNCHHEYRSDRHASLLLNARAGSTSNADLLSLRPWRHQQILPALAAVAPEKRASKNSVDPRARQAAVIVQRPAGCRISCEPRRL